MRLSGVHNSRESLDEYDEVIGDWIGRQQLPAPNDKPQDTVGDLAARYLAQHHKKPDHAKAAMKLLVELYGVVAEQPIQADVEG